MRLWSLDRAPGETSNMCAVHCLSIPVFIERVCALHGIDPSEAKIQIGIDYGKSLLKITLPPHLPRN